MSIGRLFYRFPRLTLLALFLVIVSGFAALGVLGGQEDPTLVKRYGFVIAQFPGADAERIEALVVEPIERELLTYSLAACSRSVATRARGSVRWNGRCATSVANSLTTPRTKPGPCLLTRSMT